MVKEDDKCMHSVQSSNIMCLMRVGDRKCPKGQGQCTEQRGGGLEKDGD